MAASKDHVRELYTLKRKLIPEHSRLELDRKICDNFFKAFDPGSLKVVHTYLPIKKWIEVDTLPIIERLSSEFPEIEIVVPFTSMNDRSLIHLFWKPGDLLIENKWGIPEPDPDSSRRVPVQDIDLVIVPLLAFDLRGHRVGYGAGYYDRFLSECKDTTRIVGVSHFSHEDQWIKSEEYDVDLDFCITPERVYEF